MAMCRGRVPRIAANMIQFPDQAAVQESTCLLDRREKAIIETRGEQTLVGLSSLEDVLALGRRPRQRLFTEYMLAGLQRLDTHRGVERGRRGHENDIDVLACHQGLPASLHGRAVPGGQGA